VESRDYIEREFEKMVLLLAKILGLKKDGKPFLEIEQAAKTGFRELFGDDLNFEEPSILKLNSQKQQAIADILFELGTTAHEQNKPEACRKFLNQYLLVIKLAEKNSNTFSFSNLSNKGIAEKILAETF
jgi:hypothetical protein